MEVLRDEEKDFMGEKDETTQLFRKD